MESAALDGAEKGEQGLAVLREGDLEAERRVMLVDVALGLALVACGRGGGKVSGAEVERRAAWTHRCERR